MMNEHEKRIFNFLKALGFTEAAACGIMANLYCESGLRGDNVQNSYERKVGMTELIQMELIPGISQGRVSDQTRPAMDSLSGLLKEGSSLFMIFA